MAGSALAHSRVRFGVFELDPQTGQLRKSGVLLHLSPQPFKVLCLLTHRPGELVTREQIRDQVWGGDTFVDFEHGLNFVIKKIRDTLGDDAESPRYIETVPRKGYRFIGPIDISTDRELSVKPGNEPLGQAERHPSKSARRGRTILTVALTLAAIAAVLLGLNVGGLRDRLRAELPLKSAAPLPRIESVAVLPLENLSGDPEQEYFADGLTDALINDLGKVGTLRVISRTSVMRYKRAKKTLPQIAEELNVDAVVEGTVQRSGTLVRIRTQLVEARTDRHLWAESYERDAEALVQLEELTALAVAREISGRLSPAQETLLANTQRVNPQAYDAYLHGRYLWGKRRAEAETEARAYFEQALREDPGFALAYSGLADCYSVSWNVQTDRPLAEDYARKATALGPELAEGHASLGVAALYQGKFAESEKELKRAIALNPNYAMAHHWYALYLLALGRLTEALAENDRARQLDPFSLPVNYIRGVMLLSRHEYDRALEQLRTAATIEPQASAPHWQVARIHWIQGNVPEALAQWKTAALLDHDSMFLHDEEETAGAYARGGLHAALLKAAQLMERGYQDSQYKDPGREFYRPFQVAMQFGLLKDKRKALEWLNQAARHANSYFDAMIDLVVAPELDFLHADSRYRDLLRRLGLPS